MRWCILVTFIILLVLATAGMAVTVASDTRACSLRSASTLCLTRSTVRWRSLAYTFSSSQAYGSWWSFGLWLNLDGTGFVLSICLYVKLRYCSAHCALRVLDTLVRSVAVTDIWTTLHS